MFKLIIRDYSEHIISNEGSFLSKVFGIYKLKIEKTSSFRIILMENLASRLTSPILFDMKGSRSDRRVEDRVYGNLNDMSRDVVYKDLDFEDNVSSINASHEEFNLIVARLKRDSRLLEKHMIMDYSLLVIMEKATSLRNTLINKAFVATHSGFIVFIGIIDFLQTYNTKKKLEHRYKKLKNKDSIDFSSIAPTPYRKRFISMIKNIFQPEKIN